MMLKTWYGLTSYPVGLELQAQAAHWAKSYHQTTLIGLEHESVITLGKRGDPVHDVFAIQIPVLKTDRGGQATLHSPGQLVIYPVLNLRKYKLGVKDFVKLCLEATEKTLTDYGVSTKYSQGAGLDTDQGKIAFLGLRIDQGISRHGISLNVCNDLSLFSAIRPCGCSNPPLDSLKQRGKDAKPKEVFEIWCRHFEDLTELQNRVITESHFDIVSWRSW